MFYVYQRLFLCFTFTVINIVWVSSMSIRQITMSDNLNFSPYRTSAHKIAGRNAWRKDNTARGQVTMDGAASTSVEMDIFVESTAPDMDDNTSTIKINPITDDHHQEVTPYTADVEAIPSDDIDEPEATSMDSGIVIENSVIV